LRSCWVSDELVRVVLGRDPPHPLGTLPVTAGSSSDRPADGLEGGDQVARTDLLEQVAAGAAMIAAMTASSSG
jgi:hypothetical protein